MAASTKLRTEAVVGTVKAEIGARTGALDPAHGALYVPAARFASRATPGARPAAPPGSFHVVVIGKR